MKNEIGKKICPDCKSANISLLLDGSFGKYQCNNCEYKGVLIIEEKSDSNEHEEKMKKDLETLKKEMKEKKY